jgi:integrase
VLKTKAILSTRERVEAFFKTPFKKQRTLSVYKWSLKEFLKTIYPNETPLAKGRIRDSRILYDYLELYLKEERNYEEDIMNFFAAMLKADTPPLSMRQALNQVKIFLIKQGIELSQGFWLDIKDAWRGKGTDAATQDTVPSTSDLRRILGCMDERGRALFLTLISSGMRIGECLQLQLDDIFLENDPPKIRIRREYAKNGNARPTFFSSEAKEALELWLKIRDRYIRSKRTPGKKAKALEEAKAQQTPLENKEIAKDDRVFPYDTANAQEMWKNACKKAGFDRKDNSTHRWEVHIHVLRKYFRSKLSKVIPLDFVEELMGHTGYLTKAYRRHEEDELAEFYRQGEHALRIFSDVGDVTKLRQEISSQVSTQLDTVTAENANLKERLQKLENRMKHWETGSKKFMGLKDPEELDKLIANIVEKRVGEILDEYKEIQKDRLAEQKELSKHEIPKLSPAEIEETLKRGLEGIKAEQEKNGIKPITDHSGPI